MLAPPPIYGDLGANGLQPYYTELAKAVVAGGGTSGAVVPNAPQASCGAEPSQPGDFVTTRVTNTIFEGGPEIRRNLLKKLVAARGLEPLT